MVEALRELREAASPYINDAAAHEELFSATDYRNFERLNEAMNQADAALDQSPTEEE